jgi:phenylalanyl-tRNA synthetase beta chain
MKVSVAWLQKYMSEPLPQTPELVGALTFHSSEVEEVIGEGEDTVLDVKILPDRASYGLCHRGVAYELAASLGRTLAEDPLRTPLPEYPAGVAAPVNVTIDDPEKCRRYMAARITGVKVGPSPEWLRRALERVGQRSINNIVDATNYVMLNIGQPLHAFDAGKLDVKSGAPEVRVRGAHAGESITTLTGDEYALPEGTLLITDGTNDAVLGIAGVKGGKAAELTETTTDLIIEAANFEATGIRKASQALKLWTDASLRFQNSLSPELVAYGMRDVVALIQELAGGELHGVVDAYPTPETPRAPVTATREMLNGLLGTSFSVEEIEGALTQLSLSYVKEGETFTVRPPFERRDIAIWQDLAEEVGRILGYECVTPAALPAMQAAPDQKEFAGIEAIKDVLVAHGFTEISTPSFAAEGEIALANPLQQERPFLRASLAANMDDALARAAAIAPRALGPEPMLKLFELGTVFTKGGEHLSLALGYRQLVGKASAAVLDEAVDALTTAFPASGIAKPERASEAGAPGSLIELSLENVDLDSIGAQAELARISLGAYTPFSIYPFALRDIAVWTPEGTEESQVALLIQEQASELLARMDLFDRFEKAGDEGTRISYAFRLVFQADDRTLSDADIDPLMTRITDALNANAGWQVR